MGTVDCSEILKKYLETKKELDEIEKSYKLLLGCRPRDEFSNVLEEYEKESSISSMKCTLRKTVNKQPILKDSAESTEESSNEDDSPIKRGTLQSAVISEVSNASSRKDVICKQNIKVKSRNRRILGMLQSTLRKFQDEAEKRQPQDLKRRKIEQRVEAAKEEEKLHIEQEKKNLYLKTKEKKSQLEGLDQMMEIMEPFEVWKKSQNYLLNYIMTKAEPRICFLPLSHTSSSIKHLKKSKTEIQENIKKAESVMKETLDKVMESYHIPNSFATEEKLKMSSW